MALTSTSTSVPGTRRARSRVDTNLRNAAIALVAAIVVEVALVAALVGFNSSLTHHAPGHSTCPPTSYVVHHATVTTNKTTITANTVPGVPGLAKAPPTKNNDTVIHVDCGVTGAGLVVAHIVLVLLVLGGMAAPAFAVVALMRALRSRRLVREERYSDARIAAEDSRDAVWYVVGFGLTMLVVTFIAVLFSGSDGAVRTVLWNWKYPLRSRTVLLKAFLWNIALFVVTEVIVLAWALIVAVVRQLPGRPTRPIRWLAIAYTDVFRGVPAIIVIYLVCLGLPLGKVAPFTHLEGNAKVFWLGVLALTMVYGAYVAEVYRAGIESIHWSQGTAARSLGLSQWQTYRYVIVPQAVRRIVPPLLNDFVALQKDTALVGFVGLIEVLNEASLLNSHYFNLTPVTFAAVLFLLPTIPLTRYVDRMLNASNFAPRPGDVPFLEIAGVHKWFSENHVLHGVDLDVEEHQVVCLIGPSGCGKSTLLRCINALEPIQEGEIRVDGERVSGRGVDVNALRQDVGIVFQSFNLFPHMTVLQNITLAPIKTLGLPKKDAHDRAYTLLARFGLAEKSEEYPDRLSGGQQQRVAIVRALAMRPRVMLLDEITSALDPELVSEVLNIVRDLAHEGMTMLIATHEMGFAREVSSKVCFLYAGRIEEAGPPAKIFSEPTSERTRQFLRSIIEAGRL